jgi:hypothetical protein
MPLEERQAAIRRLEKLRPNRRIVVVCNLDRASDPPQLPGLSSQIQEDLKEPLFRVLKETLQPGQGLDIVLYTRGGATNAVWPIVGLLREFDSSFEVLIPFRAHSSGTLLALGAKKIVMGPLAELSPIDPTTANQFNPRDTLNQQAMLGIAVEDVTAYQEFWKQALDFKNDEMKVDQKYALLQPHINRLATEIHPLALGNVHRVYLQINLLARMLLNHHYPGDESGTKKIIDSLTREYYSHHHMINRHEAQKILGEDHIEIADKPLSAALDTLLRHYEDDFAMRRTFYFGRYMGDDVEKSARFIGAVVESAKWSYLSSTELKLRQYLAPPAGIQIQIPPGATAPLVPGLPRQYEWQITDQTWQRNTAPKGITL